MKATRPVRLSRGAAFVASLLWCSSATAIDLDAHPRLVEIVDDLVANEGLERETLVKWLSDAEFKESIIASITRPAEALPWHRYRALFINDAQIAGGVQFMNEHRELLERASSTYGVDPLIITAIIGIETRFGTVKGNHRVIDSLTTLSVGYPRRVSSFPKSFGNICF
jgi:membrane-bound lytic murein transglycosylase B